MDKPALQSFAENYVKAQDEAIADLVADIMRYGKVSKAEAEKVLSFWRKKKWIKFDHIMRRYDIKAGNMLDKSFIRGSLEA